MIKLSNLPMHILEMAKRYEKKGENMEVFPAKMVMDGKSYYYFCYPPSWGQLIVREDGVVPPVEEIKKVFIYSNGFNASVDALGTGGESLRKRSMKKYTQLQTLLKKVEQLFQDIEAPDDVQESLASFQKAPDVIIKHQEVIERSVNSARKLTVDTRKRGVVTLEEDYPKMRGYQVEMVRSAYWQNMIQFRTAADREKVMEYLASIRSLSNWKAWWLYLQLKTYQKNMYTQAKNPKEYQEFQELGEEIFEDIPLGENKELLEEVQYLRNPRR
ncbi:hypothetical protein [Melghirimyces algeriensis]|uniref:Uncharacterized protein n=1 Tax=Melghirimyces algeriensis TaxID=910412 RepID=A0A521E915_9BACL|nr:hypothetical protein [Melghirimyces algeriensis]SMO80399.1 hypothetical protein SAMN06264849_108109 [Melghirimyces algeriensis]